MDKHIYNSIFGRANKLPEIYNELSSTFGLIPITDIKQKYVGPRSIQYGYGIKNPKEEIPEYSKFGNNIILSRKLYYKNILSIKDKSKHAVEGLKNTRVSDKFVELVFKVLKNEDVSEKEIKSLSPLEKEMYVRIMCLSGLRKEHNNLIADEHIKNLKNRLKLIEGELEAGNDNKELYIELKQILFKMFHYHLITMSGIKKYLSQF